MYVVRWLLMRGKRPPYLREEEYHTFEGALAKFLELDRDNYVERVDLIADKGIYSASRGGAGLDISMEAMRDRMKIDREREDDED